MQLIRSRIVYAVSSSGGGGGTWGSITGNLPDQLDLQAALDLKADKFIIWEDVDMSATSTYTAVQGDNNKGKALSKATAITYNLPVLIAGTQFAVRRTGAGVITFAGVGTTITASQGVLTDAGLNALMYVSYKTTTEIYLDNGLTSSGGGAVDSVNGQTGVVVLDAGDVGADPAGSAAAAQAASQPLDSDLTAIAALTTTSFGRALLELSNVAAAKTTLEIPVNTFQSGVYYSNNITGLATTTQPLANGTLRAFKWRLDGPLTITEIVSEVTTLQAASSYRIGIYTDSAGYPASLVSGTDVGTYDSTGTGVKSSGAISVALAPGYYWIVFNSNSNPSLRAHSISNVLALGTAGTLGSNSFQTGLSVAQAYGAMPSTFPAGGTLNTNACPTAAFKA